MNPDGIVIKSSTLPATVSNGNSDDNSSLNNLSGSCACFGSAREYAFVDCSEVYLSGKRTSGIYEIW